MATTRTTRTSKATARTSTAELSSTIALNTEFLARNGIVRQFQSDLGSSIGFGDSRSFFEAASNSPSIEFAPDYGPNSANGELDKIRRRSRWTFANDGFYANACRQVANNVIGYGIKDPVLRKLWRRWEREADACGALPLHLLAHGIYVAEPRDGESFVRFRLRRKEDMRSGVPFQLQVLESDYVPTEKNPIDRVDAIWMYDHHPKDFARLDKRSLLPKRVPASEVLHLYRPDRFESVRGVPWGAPALNKA